jgi:hypothetical protein
MPDNPSRLGVLLDGFPGQRDETWRRRTEEGEGALQLG